MEGQSKHLLGQTSSGQLQQPCQNTTLSCGFKNSFGKDKIPGSLTPALALQVHLPEAYANDFSAQAQRGFDVCL